MILLDTHVVIWLASNSEKLSAQAVSAIRSDHDGLAISGITLYEIALLAARGRVNLRTSTDLFLREVERLFIVKPITGSISIEAQRLPAIYPKDPMDRLIGATAIVEGLALITADAAIQKSKAVSTIW